MMVLDKVFKAYDIRGIYGEEIDADLTWKIGHGAAQFLRSRLSGYDRGQASTNKVVVGRDMRPHSEGLSRELIEGIVSSGLTAVDIGMCDTPMIYFAVNHLGACGGIQVTASHNPIEYNGFKISAVRAKPVGRDSGLQEIKHIVSTLRRMPEGAALAPRQSADLWAEYRRHVLRFCRPLRKLKIVVDASNGMAGKMMPEIFGDVAELEIIPLHFEIGQGFVHPPNPLVEANLQDTKDGVIEYGADLGVCLDGDADRCMFVDEKGQTVRCDLMTALLSRHFLAENRGAVVVYDLRSSRATPEEIRAAGGVPRRERVGHAYMKKAMAEAQGIFGGELSGHFYFRDNFNCDSGAIAFATAVTVLANQQRPFSQLVEPLRRYSHSGEVNFEVEDKEAKMAEVEQAYHDAEIDHLDGVTCQYGDWWLNVRPSNTEPLLRLSLEARTEEMMHEKLGEVEGLLGEPVDH